MTMSCTECGSAPRRSLKYCSRLSRMHSSMCFLLMRCSTAVASLAAGTAAAAAAGGSRQFVEEGGHRAHLRVAAVQRVHRRAEGLAAGQRAHRPADVLARGAHAECARRTARSGPAGVRAASRCTSRVAGGARQRAVCQEVRDLAKDPRPALRGAADHHRVAAGVVQHLRAPCAASRCRRWRPPECAAPP